MTEDEWLQSDELQLHIEYLSRTRGPVLRKLRLFSIAYCRQVLPWIDGPQVRKALAQSEEYADGRLTSPALAKWRRVVEQMHLKAARRRTMRLSPAMDAAYRCVAVACWPHGRGFDQCWHWLIGDEAEPFGPTARVTGVGAAHDLLAEVFGNPFRPVAFDPAWRTATVLAIAEPAYADRAFDRLPILADALEDAGCDADELLAHLRGPGPHVRGCWALDLVLGKA